MARKKGQANASNSDNGNEHAAFLYEWISEGYFVDPLMESIRSGDQQKIEDAFQKYSVLIERLAAVREKMEKLGLDKEHSAYGKISDKLYDPTQVETLESLVLEFETGPRYKELKAELASINTVGFEEDANRIRVMFDNRENLDNVDNEIKMLKKKVKEKFFEVAFEETVEPETPEKKTTAEIIFLMHRDGTLLSVKSRNPPTALDKKLMSRMVMAIKEQKSRAFKENEHIHSLTYEGHTIILEDSAHVYAAVVILGEAKPVMYRVLLKALQIMERKLAPQFEAWKGDRSTLENLDKYVTAIFQALDKVN